jgi:DNA-binding ferritin-like protein
MTPHACGVDDTARPSIPTNEHAFGVDDAPPIPGPVPDLGHFNQVLLGQSCRAPKHVLLDEQAEQVFAMTDAIAERGRKIGGKTLRSVGNISRRQRLKDNDEEMLTSQTMLSELLDDNSQLTAHMRETHEICAKNNDVATASLIEVWIDETERRTWFLAEVTRGL